MTAKPKTKAAQNDDAAEARAARRAGQSAKMAWIKDIAADRAVTVATRHVWMTAAIHHGYSRMSVHATRRHLAELAGVSDSVVKRAISEGIGKGYVSVENPGAGSTNHYTLLSADAREQNRRNVLAWLKAEWHAWMDAERWWKNRCEQWLETEKNYALAAKEQKYTTAIADAIRARGGDSDRAVLSAAGIWEQHLVSGETVDQVLAQLDQMSEDEFRRLFEPPPKPEANGSDTAHTPAGNGPDVTHQWAIGDPSMGQIRPINGSAATKNGSSPSPLAAETRLPQGVTRSKRTSYSKKQSSHARPPDAGRALAVKEKYPTSTVDVGRTMPDADVCSLCDDHGHALNLDTGTPMELVRCTEHPRYNDDDIEDNCRPFLCTHSKDDNRRALQRLVDTQAEFGPTWTGYGPQIDGDDDDVE